MKQLIKILLISFVSLMFIGLQGCQSKKGAYSPCSRMKQEFHTARKNHLKHHLNGIKVRQARLKNINIELQLLNKLSQKKSPHTDTIKKQLKITQDLIYLMKVVLERDKGLHDYTNAVFNTLNFEDQIKYYKIRYECNKETYQADDKIKIFMNKTSLTTVCQQQKNITIKHKTTLKIYKKMLADLKNNYYDGIKRMRASKDPIIKAYFKTHAKSNTLHNTSRQNFHITMASDYAVNQLVDNFETCSKNNKP